MELRGEMTGKVFKLGQRVLVRTDAADPVAKTIDFVLEKEVL
jgi:ribonuclease R